MAAGSAQLQQKAKEQQAVWAAYDRFVIAALQDCIKRIENANAALNKHAKAVSVQTLGMEDAAKIVDGLAKAGEIDEQKFGELSATIQNFANSEKFMKLIGLIKHSSLLRKQLSNMVAVMTKLSELDQATGDREMKQQFAKYGMSLTHIWRHCEEYCSTIMEKRILRAVVAPNQSGTAETPAKKAS